MCEAAASKPPGISSGAMSGYLLILLVALPGTAAVVAAYILVRRRKRRRRISEVIADPNLLARWTYTPDEWRRAAEEEFTWVRGRDSSGEVYISPSAIYARDDSRDRLIDLSGDGRKVVTHASYRQGGGGPIKLRVRWKVVEQHADGPDRVKYYKEDYRVPVPPRYAGEAGRVAEFFSARLSDNLDAYAAVVPEDEPISLFGNDSY